MRGPRLRLASVSVVTLLQASMAIGSERSVWRVHEKIQGLHLRSEDARSLIERLSRAGGTKSSGNERQAQRLVERIAEGWSIDAERTYDFDGSVIRVQNKLLSSSNPEDQVNHNAIRVDYSDGKKGAHYTASPSQPTLMGRVSQEPGFRMSDGGYGPVELLLSDSIPVRWLVSKLGAAVRQTSQGFELDDVSLPKPVRYQVTVDKSTGLISSAIHREGKSSIEFRVTRTSQDTKGRWHIDSYVRVTESNGRALRTVRFDRRRTAPIDDDSLAGFGPEGARVRDHRLDSAAEIDYVKGKALPGVAELTSIRDHRTIPGVAYRGLMNSLAGIALVFGAVTGSAVWAIRRRQASREKIGNSSSSP